MGKNLTVGVDFGTTNSVLVCRSGDGPNVQITDENSPLIPSCVYELPDGRMLCGKKAYEMGKSNRSRLHTHFKMQLLSDVASERAQAQQHLELFCKHLYQLVADTIDFDDYETVEVRFSYPATWGTKMVELEKSALIKAGFKGKYVAVREPEAAVRYSIEKNMQSIVRRDALEKGKEYVALSVDAGAGTFDISMLKFVLTDEGEFLFKDLQSYPRRLTRGKFGGGSELDALLAGYVAETWFGGDATMFGKFEAKSWKETTLCDELNEDNAVTPPACLFSDGSFAFDRKTFEEVTASHWDNLKLMVKDALESYAETGVNPQEIDFVILAGGHSRWYVIKDMFLNGFDGYVFPKIVSEPDERLICDKKPEQSVARGLMQWTDAVVYEYFSPCNIWCAIYVDSEKVGKEIVVRKGIDTLPFKEDWSFCGCGSSFIWNEHSKMSLYFYKGEESGSNLIHKAHFCVDERPESALGKVGVFAMSSALVMSLKRTHYEMIVNAEIEITKNFKVSLVKSSSWFRSLDEKREDYAYDPILDDPHYL